jgi:hypothetical protein
VILKPRPIAIQRHQNYALSISLAGFMPKTNCGKKYQMVAFQGFTCFTKLFIS